MNKKKFIPLAKDVINLEIKALQKLKTSLNNIWLFKSDLELIVEDSIIVDNNNTKPTKQIVIKGVLSDKKIIRKWSLQKI